MATAATLQLKNHAGTEVNYKVMNVSNDVVIWADDSPGVLNGYREASLGRKLPTDRTNGTVRIEGRIKRPTLDGATGAVNYTCLGTFELVLPAKASLAERQEVLAALKDLVADTVVSTAMTSFELPY